MLIVCKYFKHDRYHVALSHNFISEPNVGLKHATLFLILCGF